MQQNSVPEHIILSTVECCHLQLVELSSTAVAYVNLLCFTCNNPKEILDCNRGESVKKVGSPIMYKIQSTTWAVLSRI